MNWRAPLLAIAAGLAFVACDDDSPDNDGDPIVDVVPTGEISTVGDDDDEGTVGDTGSLPPVVTSAPAGTAPVVPNSSAAP